MTEAERYLRSLLSQQKIESPHQFTEVFLEFVLAEENIKNVKLIQELQAQMTKNWQIIARRHEINELFIALPNGISGKEYKAVFDLDALGLNDITKYTLSGFEASGLEFNKETRVIAGIPLQSGDIKLAFTYKFDGEPEDAQLNSKTISIIINPDPKSLWKNIPSDISDRFAKPDEQAETIALAGKTLIVASKRGRSHANIGSFREDDYAVANLQDGWGIIALSDGAGSASFSRKGSDIACNTVITYFTENMTGEFCSLLNEAVIADNPENKIKNLVMPYLKEAVRDVYNNLKAFADIEEISLQELHATLIFALVRKYPQGYVFMTFGVGDCPIALIGKEIRSVELLNTLDVGEFGGGTRFITLPEIFEAKEFDSRFTVKFVPDFAYLTLMTDGIYDPKFEVEANLESAAKWQQFFEDLNGNNPDKVKVTLEGDAPHNELSLWMDFWSPGNHDDRTLAILF